MFALLNGLSDRMMMVIITAQLMTILNGETRPGSRIEQTHLTHSQFGQMGPTKLHITGKQAQPKTSENVTNANAKFYHFWDIDKYWGIK